MNWWFFYSTTQKKFDDVVKNDDKNFEACFGALFNKTNLKWRVGLKETLKKKVNAKTLNPNNKKAQTPLLTLPTKSDTGVHVRDSLFQKTFFLDHFLWIFFCVKKTLFDFILKPLEYKWECIWSEKKTKKTKKKTTKTT